MKKIPLLFALFFLTAKSAYTQHLTLKGKVINQNKQPVPFINAILLKNTNVKPTASTSDSLGTFVISAEPGEYTLLIKQFGLILLKREILLDQTIDLGEILVNDPLLLKGVVISGNKKVLEQVGDKLYFNVENSPLAKGNNGIDILQKSPKLYVNADGGILLKNKAATVLIDGRKTNLSGTDLNTYLSSLNAEDIKRVEIQDLASADQDAATDGGVVNIVLKRNTKGLRTIASTNYTYRKENYGSYAGNINLNYGDSNWNVYANAAYSDNKDQGRSNGSINYYNGQKNIRTGAFDIANNDLSFRLGSTVTINDRNDIGIEGYLDRYRSDYDNQGDVNILRNNESTAIHSINRSDAKNRDKLWYTTLNYTFKTDDKGSQLKFIGDIGVKNSNPFNDILARYPEDNSLNSHYQYNTDANSNYYTLQLDLNQKLEDKWELSTGIKYGSVKRDNTLMVQYLQNNQWTNDLIQNQDFDNRENIAAGYAFLSKTISKSFFKVGLRMEETDIKGINRINTQDVKQSYLKFFPSLYYSYEISKDKTVALSYRRSLIRPFFSDLNPFVIKQNDFLYLIGNPKLRPSYIDRIELALNYKKNSLSLFGKKTMQTIQGAYTVDENFVSYFQPQNFGKLYDAGLDYSFNASITKWLYGSLSTGVFYSDFKAIDGITTKGTSFYNNIYLQAKFPDNWLIEIINNYQHRYYSNNLRGEPKYKTDVSVRKSFDKGRLLATLKMTDIFNTRTDENTAYYKDFNSYYFRKLISRTIMLQIQYTLDSKREIKSNTVKSENDSRGRL